MEAFGSISIMLVLVIIYTGEYPVRCAKITDVPNKIGMLYEPLNITCAFTLDTGDDFDRIKWYRKRSEDGDYVAIAKIKGETGNVFYPDGKDLENRSNLTLINNVGSIDIYRLECGDAALYKCELESSQEPDPIEKEMTEELKIQATPPSRLDQPPAEVAEFDNITFECQSDVTVSPPGSITWYGIRGNENKTLTGAENVINDTVNNCTKNVVSTLVLNVSRDDNGMIIRCQTPHPNLEDPPQYLDSNPVVVNYPVEEDNLVVSQSPNLTEHEEGTSVNLTCTITTVPSAVYTLHHLESNTTHDAGSTGVKHFMAVLPSDGGTYTCEAVNSFFNVTFKALKNHTLIVRSLPTTSAENTTLPTTLDTTTSPTISSTTTTIFTMSTSPDGNVTDASTEPDDGSLPTTSAENTTLPTTLDTTTSPTIPSTTTTTFTMSTSPDGNVTDASTEPDDGSLPTTSAENTTLLTTLDTTTSPTISSTTATTFTMSTSPDGNVTDASTEPDDGNLTTFPTTTSRTIPPTTTTIVTMSTSPDGSVTDASTEPDDEGLSGGVIAGIIIGCLAGLGVASVLIYLLIIKPKTGSKVEISPPAVSGRLA